MTTPRPSSASARQRRYRRRLRSRRARTGGRAPVRLSLAEAVERALAASAQLRGSSSSAWPPAPSSRARAPSGCPPPTWARATPGAPTSSSSGFLSRRASRPWSSRTSPTTTLLAAGAPAALHRRAHHRADRGGPESERPPGSTWKPAAADLVLETKAAYWTLVTARDERGVLREGLDGLRGPPEGRPQPRALRAGGAQRGAGGPGRARPRRAAAPARRERRRGGRGQPGAPASASAGHHRRANARRSRACRWPAKTSRRSSRAALEARPERAGLLARLTAAEAGVR